MSAKPDVRADPKLILSDYMGLDDERAKRMQRAEEIVSLFAAWMEAGAAPTGEIQKRLIELIAEL